VIVFPEKKRRKPETQSGIPSKYSYSIPKKVKAPIVWIVIHGCSVAEKPPVQLSMLEDRRSRVEQVPGSRAQLDEFFLLVPLSLGRIPVFAKRSFPLLLRQWSPAEWWRTGVALVFIPISPSRATIVMVI